MKLSWRDIVTTLLLAMGSVILYAKLQDYSWWLVGTWRGTVAALGVLGVAMCITAAGDPENRSILNRLETYLGFFAGIGIIAGLITGWQWIGLTLAATIGFLWLVSTVRHTRRSVLHIETPAGHSGAYAH